MVHTANLIGRIGAAAHKDPAEIAAKAGSH
ncbi:hypothetical protein BJG92_00100 [Arthrobacter sp. SO5]|nr:hypothetical protein [Arthrobacter sp. SO5]